MGILPNILSHRWSEKLLRGGSMGRFSWNRHLLGLDIGSQAIKLVQVRKDQGNWHLHRFGVIDIASTRNGAGDDYSTSKVGERVKDLIRENHVQGTRVATAMNGAAVITKMIEMPSMTQQELAEHLEWELDQYVPVPPSQLYWDFVVSTPSNGTNGSRMTVLLVAAKKDMVNERLELLRQVGLDPIIVDIDGLTLINMYVWNYKPEEHEVVLLVNVGPSGLTMSLVEGKRPVYLRNATIGGRWQKDVLDGKGEEIPENVEKDSGRLEEQEALDVLRDDLYVEMAGEIRKTIDYCQENFPKGQVENIFLCGGYAGLPGLVEKVGRHLSLPVRMANPFKTLAREAGREDMRKASLAGVAVGLALRAIGE